MPYEDADIRTDQIARESIRRLSNRLVAPFLVNREYQQYFTAGAGKVQAYKYESTEHWDDTEAVGPATNAVKEETFNMALSWPTTTNEDAYSLVDFEPTDAVSDQWFVPLRAIRQVQGGPEARATEYLVKRLTTKIDSSVFTDFITKLTAVSGRVTQTDNTTPSYIDDNGKVTGTADDQLYEFFDAFYLYKEANAFGDTAETPIQTFCLMSPPSWIGLKNKILESNYADALNIEALRSNRILSPGADRFIRGVIDDTAIIVTPRVTDTTVGGKKHRNVIFFSRNAYTLAMLPPVMEVLRSGASTNVNTLGDGTTGGARKLGTLVREIIPYGGLLIDNRLARILQVRGEA